MVGVSEDDPLLDADAGPVVRPYSVTYGRTRPRSALDMVTMLRATGRKPQHMEPEHAEALRLCQSVISVAEVAAHLQQPLVVAKVLLADLIAWDALIAGVPVVDTPDLRILKDLLDGLRQLQLSSDSDSDGSEDPDRGRLRGGQDHAGQGGQ